MMMRQTTDNKIRRWGKWLLPLYLLAWMALPAMSATKAAADSAYTQGRYQQAIALYEQLLGNTVWSFSPDYQ